MKPTKNMIYKPSTEARELYVFSDNYEPLYKYYLQICGSIKKHYDRGAFDLQLATVALYRFTTEAAREYCKLYCSRGEKYYNVFSVSDRWTAAADLAEALQSDLEYGNF